MPIQRVLWLFEFPSLLGGERSLLAMLPRLRAEGWEPEAMGPAAGPLAEELARLEVPLHPFECREPAQPRRGELPQLREELARWLARHPSEIVHANSLAMSRLAGPVLKELRRTNLGHLRDIVKLSRQAVTDLNGLDRLLAVSAASRNFHIQQGLEAGRCEVLHNGVDLSEFRPRRPTLWLHRELQLPEQVQLVGTVGQLVLRKGHDTLVAAAKELADEFPQLHYLFVGECPSQKAESQAHLAALQAAFDSGPLRGRGHFLGNRSDVAKLLPEFTVLVHPARQEPLGRVLLEGAAAGCAIVATNVGGTPEIFPPESEAAVLVRPHDASHLAEALRRLLANASTRQQLSQNARARAVKAFALERAAAGLASAYQRLVQGTGDK